MGHFYFIIHSGVAFQETGDWDKAAEASEQVVAIDADYNDTRTRLTEVRTKQQVATATAQAEAVQATATAQAQAMAAAATATAEALTQLETTYQKCLGAINLERWTDAKEACDQVFAIDPNYKDIL